LGYQPNDMRVDWAWEAEGSGGVGGGGGYAVAGGDDVDGLIRFSGPVAEEGPGEDFAADQ